MHVRRRFIAAGQAKDLRYLTAVNRRNGWSLFLQQANEENEINHSPPG
jgi:hypothetical protein